MDKTFNKTFQLFSVLQAMPWLLVLQLLVVAPVCDAKDLLLEAENVLFDSPTSYRSGASDGKAVRLATGDVLYGGFCLKQQTVVQMHSVLYSNDGPSELLLVSVDHSMVGFFTTHSKSNYGQLWNEFQSSTPFTYNVSLAPGWHSLRIGVIGSSDGVEIDAIKFSLNDKGISKGVLECSLFCQLELPVVNISSNNDAPTAEVKQASYSTPCAEEDNVKIPLYSSEVQNYSITATQPTYITYFNERTNDDSNCQHLSPLLWSFSSLPNVQPDRPYATTDPLSKADLLLYSNASGSVNLLTFRVAFMLKGRSDGFVNAEMGSTLTFHVGLTANSGSDQVVVNASFLGRSGTPTTVKHSTLSPGQTQHKITFPDFTWREKDDNVVIVTLETQNVITVPHIDMERRPMKGEKVTKVVDAKGVIVETVEVDFWWRRPDMMVLVNGETGEEWQPVDLFRIYISLPWNRTSYAQVMVMYQDGNVRLVSKPPQEVDWIPFGTSVLVGYNQPNDLRPSAPVTSVTLYPSTLEMRVLYQDGSGAWMKLVTGDDYTKLLVGLEHGQTGAGSNLPFATFRSMYIEDGLSDSDTLMVDGKFQHNVMDSWGSNLSGRTFTLYRRCESTHLTLSPDVTINMLSGPIRSQGITRQNKKNMKQWFRKIISAWFTL